MSDPLHLLFARLRASAGRPVDLIGVGECSLDRVLRLPGRLAELVPLLTDPLSGGKLSASSLDVLGGGQIATALVAASRLGCRTAFAGVVGDDADGREVLAGLQAEDVDTAPATVLPGLPTRSALILVDEGGERVVLEYRHPELMPRATDLSPSLLGRARIVHVDATFPAVAHQVLLDAKAAGAVCSLDLDRGDPEAAALLPLADLALVAAGVPGRLTGYSNIEDATRQLARQIPGLLVVTLGVAGSLLALRDGSEVVLHPQAAYPAVAGAGLPDTTACGDTYRAVLLATLLAEPPEQTETEEPLAHLQRAMRHGSAAAALKCRALGRRGCPTAAELAEFLARS